MPTFEIISGPNAGRTHRTHDEDITVGRSGACTITLEDTGASDRHAGISRNGGRYVLTDMDSEGGTLINGHRIQQIPLCDGDEIQVGNTVLRYSPDVEAEPEAEPSQQPESQAKAERSPAPAPPPPPLPRAGSPGADARRVRLGRRLLHKIVCSSCLFSFPPEDVLFVSRHPDLLGDPVAGDDEYRRFEPVRFTVDWEALDEKGVPTAQIACPRCHFALPEAALEVQPMFVSIVGSPASGKSYLLTAMTHTLRRVLPSQFALGFTDSDLVTNTVIRDNEDRLFHNPRPDEPTDIQKTQQDDARVHRTARIQGVDIRYPMPFQFLLWPADEHPGYERAHKLGRIVVLYDNAGEDFLPRGEEMSSEAIHHLAESELIFVLFDPIQEPAFRHYCRSDDPQLTDGLRPGSGAAPVQYRQEIIVNQVGDRIRRYLKLPRNKRIRIPLIVIVPKFDIWARLAGASVEEEPLLDSSPDGRARLNLPLVERTSQNLRDLFRELCPDFVATTESISETVRYIPVTSLGCSPAVVRPGGRPPFYGVRPADIRPKWVTVPLLYYLARWGPKGILGEATAPGGEQGTAQ